MRSLLAGAAMLALALTHAAQATAPVAASPNMPTPEPTSVPANRIPIPLNKPISQITWGTTHNSFSYHQFPVRAQNRNMGQQLADGIGALMLDLHPHKGRAYVCHKDCNDLGFNGRIYPLSEWLNDDILPFMEKNPDAILTIFLESYVEKNLLEAELLRAPKVAAMTFNPDTWSNTRSDWPTARELIADGQRILIFTDKASNKGNYTLPGGTAHVMFDRDGTMENNYETFGATVFTHNYSCQDHPWKPSLSQGKVAFPNKSWPKLFLMNQFHGLGESIHAKTDNNNSHLFRRVEGECRKKTGRVPNFIAVDFYEQGDVLDYAATLSHGGIVLWEGNNATQDIVCTIPYIGGQRSIDFQSGGQFVNGCENDEARSATLLNMKAGSKFRLFDSPSGSRNDDWTYVEVLKDVSNYTISSFENSQSDSSVEKRHIHNNGLDGKVSRLSMGYDEPPMVVFYEGNNTSQNIVCTIVWDPGTRHKAVNFKSNSLGCDNDEARSAKFFNIKANTHITIYDSPDGAHSDDFISIVTKRDMKYFSLDTFEKTVSNSDYTATYNRKNGLDGKVSRFLMYDNYLALPAKKAQR